MYFTNHILWVDFKLIVDATGVSVTACQKLQNDLYLSFTNTKCIMDENPEENILTLTSAYVNFCKTVETGLELDFGIGFPSGIRFSDTALRFCWKHASCQHRETKRMRQGSVFDDIEEVKV